MKLRLFFWRYFILFTIAFLACDTYPALSNIHPKKSISLYSQISVEYADFKLKEHDSNSQKHCEIVELPSIPVPVSHELKNKYTSRIKYHFIIYSKRAKSLLDTDNQVFSSTINISPLSVILQI
jgi:hypothetical protein